ncbi:type II toxin-antitoxin system Phd/YefM family antitoxin [Pseudomonas frederiksbergensis]|jgi:prevent-host-death family protein|uniref:type II toxin-antitoxin system Phd/YefM family antitoxin n=1 Tax=Pseudomonas TaxID=286 RepID=UPI001F469102|nr:type II toxin-antitoxin system prevent-host-death family antitoxin [Pseudomonas frederiksbergensis]
MKRDIFYELVDGSDALATGRRNEASPERYDIKPTLLPFVCAEVLRNFAAPQNSGYICPEYREGRIMIIVPLAEAKNNLSKLVDDAAAGQVITIAKHGRPLARLVPVERPRGQRIGAMKGKLILTDGFDAALPDDLLDAFEGQQP